MKLSAAAVSDAAARFIADGRTAEALVLADKALEMDPGFALAHCNRGLALNILHRHDEAVASFERALQCDPTKQFIALNLADSLQQLGRADEAFKALHSAHLTLPLPIIKANLGTAYYGAGDFVRAEAYFREAIFQDVALIKAHSNLSICCLMQGRWREGWEEFCWRFAADGVDVRETELHTWDGEAINSLLVLAESGIGEEILWLGCLSDLLARGIKVWLECDVRLHPLIARTYPTVGLIPRMGEREVPPDCLVEAVCDMGDLGRFFRNEDADFYRSVPEYLRAARTMRLPPFAGLTVGISWLSTSPKFGPIKSLPLAEWEPLLSLPGVRFVDLQYGEREFDPRVIDTGLDTKNDIDGLASLICECDVVLTVSNTTAHLAGALGIPCWVLLPPGYGRFWYWGTGDRTPWYPSLTLFQNKTGWADVVERVRKALEAKT